jgi:hypothetical protein
MVSPPSTVASDDQSADYSNHCRSVRCLQETLMVSPPSITATDDQSTGYNSRNHLRSFLTSQMDFYFHIMREFLDLLKNHYFLRTVLRGAGWCCLSVILYSDKEIFRRCIFDTSARHWLTLRLHATDWRYVCAPLADIMSSRHWLTSARHWLTLCLHATDCCYVCTPLTDVMSARHWQILCLHATDWRLHATDWCYVCTPLTDVTCYMTSTTLKNSNYSTTATLFRCSDLPTKKLNGTFCDKLKRKAKAIISYLRSSTLLSDRYCVRYGAMVLFLIQQ